MELKPENALKLAYEKRKQVLEATNAALTTYSQGRENQIQESTEEKTGLNTLSFGIAGAVLSFSPSSLENNFVIAGLLILILNAFVFGFIASWHQRRLNIKNYEDAIKETKDMARPFFDAYDQFISHEPPQQVLFEIQQDAYISYLDKQKEQSENFRVAKRSPLSAGGWYFLIFAIGFSIVCIGLFQKYHLDGGDVTKVEIMNSVEVNGSVHLRR